MSDTTLEAVFESEIEDREAEFLCGEISLRAPADALLLPDTGILPVGADQPMAYDRPTKRTRRSGCCD